MRRPHRARPTPRHSLLSGIFRQERTSRLLLGLLTASCLLLASWARIIPPTLDLQEGETSLRTIHAPRGGAYVDEEEMARLQDEAAFSTPEVYDTDPHATEEALGAVEDVFGSFRETRANPLLRSPQAKTQQLSETVDIGLSRATLQLAVTAPDPALNRVKQGILILVRDAMAREIRSNTDDLDRARSRLAQAAHKLGYSALYASLAIEIGSAALKNNRILDTQKTQAAREAKRDAVKSISHQIQPGDVIILAGEEVRSHHIAAFQAVGLMQATVDYTQAGGVLLMCALIILSLWMFTKRFVRRCYDDLAQLGVLSALLVAAAFAYRTLEPTSWFEPGAITTATAAAMVVAILLDPLLAAGTGVTLGLLLPIITPGSDARLPIVVVLCSVVATFAIKRRGSQSSVVARAAPLMAAVNVAAFLLGGEVFGVEVSARTVMIVAFGGLAAPLLAAGTVIALERLVGVTTDMRLMELGNPNEPILRRLLSEAPGSYQHSIMVGNLAEAAAEVIGANALLVRTAAMYHDIGKVSRPFFFVENQFGGQNRHDRLSPHLSSLIITAHVKDGLELAREARLPRAIQDGIAEHHGTTLVRYFYQRSLALTPPTEEVPESAFRYPGPRPLSRETAVLMLADSIEAAARTLDAHDHQHIKGLVDRVVDEKVRDGQLEDSPPTFHELALVRLSFVGTLTSMFHHRIRYEEQLAQDRPPPARGRAHVAPRPDGAPVRPSGDALAANDAAAPQEEQSGAD